ncbi:Mbeg1-like protein [Streptococcus sp. S784/96/1]|uniref:Mbeg1-like protein n=1 Tax=Streptococcus sp. S784/96/1 TaxID=2653499 RepID=UPI0013870559|nr:Mbeg1-like protein [Streptococcus sp. S784/96/1]
MPTICDYVNSASNKDFEELALNDLDIVCLNELAYLPFDGYVTQDTALSFKDMRQRLKKEKSAIQYDFMLTKDRVKLFDAMLNSKRFKDLILSHYVNDISKEFEKQFAAMVFHIPSINHWQLVFRGTDDTLIGWKEDFKLTYMSEIPAQRSAVTYLQQFLEKAEQPVYVTGHSKGGNLAVYAASHQKAVLQKKIKAVFMLDAPGFNPIFFKKEGYQGIRDKLIVMRPKESIVGVMLQLDVTPFIIDANQFGVSQHAVTTWKISEKGHFISNEPTNLSKQLDKTFDQWVSELSKSELKVIVDLLFDTLMDAGINSLNDLTTKEAILKLLSAFGTMNQLDKKQQALIQKSLWNLVTAFAQNSKPDFKPSWHLDDFLKKWKIKE